MALPSSRFTAGLAAAALTATAAPAHAYDFPCFEDAMVESARIHDLRVMLMVSALKCRFDNPRTLREYTVLLDQREDEFGYHGARVREDFVERLGARRGNAEFESYNTRLSNYHSQVQPTRELCADASAFMRLAKRADDAELATLSKLVTNRAVRTCALPAGGAQARFVPPVAARERDPFADLPAPRWERAAPGGAPEMVDGVPTYTEPGSLPETRPEPLETVDVPAQQDTSDRRIASAETAASEAAAAAASGDDAKIDRAIAALSQAAEALRELKSAP
ncbi:hypothetical protein [Erythrobacter sp.]|uniref:hypothetical protein n=1 Tax=Erythrobacter sp. TaxID=1042 RepID=UPI001425DEB0|nr:hypothetical protein [Erythrobacter sp.]QIQ85623.1 MAG: hypothetical protein G9473_02185 [Erythrobacter sp.]